MMMMIIIVQSNLLMWSPVLKGHLFYAASLMSSHVFLLYLQPLLRGHLSNAVSGQVFAHRSVQCPSIKGSVARQGQALVVKHQKKCPTGHFNTLI